MSDTLKLTKELVACPSISPKDEGCLDILTSHLEPLGFNCERMPFEDVDNLWATHGDAGPLLVFIGHTDIVPPGPVEQWKSDPFTPVERNGYLYGRGTADMKGGLAAMITACERFIKVNPKHMGTIAFLITSDEEAQSINGTVKVVEELLGRGVKFDWCLVGEPSSSEFAGDVIKVGRRGSLSGNLIIHGKQGHIAYPQTADNPIHSAVPALTELSTTQWDKGNEFFQPTSFQISNVHSGTGATNVIPGDLEVHFNFRFSTESNEEDLKHRVTDILVSHRLNYSLEWHKSGDPFLTGEGVLLDAINEVVESITGKKPEASTVGGTSDGRFIAPTGAQVIELGPCNSTIHKINECVKIEDLDTVSTMYEKILESLMT